MFDEDYWEERYRSHTAVWSGHANTHLVAEATDLTPGTALDAGCGEGGDALWLAARGWQVTAVDFATTALARAAEQAEKLGLTDRVHWLHADLTTWTPPASGFDLVTANFIHLPPGERDPLFVRLASAVAPGGSLLIGGHHHSDLDTTVRRPHAPELFFTAEQVVTMLDPADWEIVAAGTRPRQTHDGEGREVTINDAVLHARRRG